MNEGLPVNSFHRLMSAELIVPSSHLFIQHTQTLPRLNELLMSDQQQIRLSGQIRLQFLRQRHHRLPAILFRFELQPQSANFAFLQIEALRVAHSRGLKLPYAGLKLVNLLENYAKKDYLQSSSGQIQISFAYVIVNCL